MSDTHAFEAWSDAAALMVAAATDRDGAHAMLAGLVESGSVAELTRTLIAAVEIGGTLIERECQHGAPGPVLEYLVAVSRASVTRSR